MNVVREINAINQKELDLGLTASWHDEYKDSARIFAGGLHTDMTEGDVITIFSQYGEIVDVNMPRDKETGKPRGFAFLMYEDQRSTILAVDNLNGAKVLERTLKVDHVKQYRQPKVKNADGEWVDQDDEVLNAVPEMIEDGGVESDSSDSSGASIDPEDPMRDYLLAQRREARSKRKEKKKKKGKHKDESPEDRAARKKEKKERKMARHGRSEGVKAVQTLLSSLGVDQRDIHRRRSRSASPDRRRESRSQSPRHRRRPSPPADHQPRRRSRYDGDEDEPRNAPAPRR